MASVNLNALTEVQTPASTDNLLLFNETSNVATRIDYDKLAEAILNKTRSEIGGVSPISAIGALNSSANMLTIGTAIPSGASLNTYTTPGTYYVSNNSIAASVDGLPEATAGRVIVETEGSATVIRQIYKPYNSLLEYVRRISGATIGAWEKLPTRAEIDALNSSLQAKLTVPYNISGTTKFTIADSYRGILFITDSTGARCGQYFVFATSGGAVGYKEVSAASGITFGSDTNELTLNIDSGARSILFITISNTAPTIKS